MVILLAVTFAFVTLLLHVRATNGVEITSITVHDTATQIGKVGDTVRIIGTVNTTDGEYQIWLGAYNVTPAEPTATENQVNATFQIPNIPNANYTITLQDVDKNINATTWLLVETAYYIKAITPSPPLQLLENDTVNIWVNVTGGKPNVVYYANVSIMIPSPLRYNYTAIVKLTNTTDTGDGFASITYPNQTLFTAIKPEPANTNYTGLYRIYFNETQNLAEDSFFVGITDKSEYHREEIVQIIAAGYESNKTANITITFLKTNKTYSWLATATQQGMINTTWLGGVPWNASIGFYNITITVNASNPKEIPDSQLFSVPGYPIQVYTRNLAGDVVPQILVEAFDKAANTTYSNTTDGNGLTSLQLEKGNHTFKPFWRGKVEIPEMQNVTITGNATYYLTCELTNMNITVKDTDGNLIPFVYLNITYQYVPTGGNVTKENMTGETGISGLFLINSMLTNINYTVNASRYGIVFNKNNNTIQDLPAEKWFNVTIVCPAKTLTLNVTENHRNPLPNAHVELIEEMGGISYNETTNDAGIVVINCTFGKYEVKVYINNIFLNETFVEIFNDTYSEIYCKLYNLTISVKVVDYFGQPISNAKVTWQLYDLEDSALTESDGLVTFSNIIGGDLKVTVYLPERSQPFMVTTLFVDNSRPIEIKLDKYVVLAGFLVETSYLTTAIIIVATVLLVLLIEVYRRKRIKPEKSSI